jgi:hypothetical protein
MVTFAIKKGFSSTETKCIHFSCIKHDDYKMKYFDRGIETTIDMIPVGTIDWVQACLKKKIIPNYYPEFLHHLLYRKIWYANDWPFLKDVFVKPYDKPKRFNSKITTGIGGCKRKRKGPYWCSELMKFVNEWRYYIVNGKIVYVGWYQGNDPEQKPFELKVNIPSHWCGCIDMGLTNDGKYALVEAGEPYAMGWYGSLDECEIYTNFIIEGNKYIKKYLMGL